VIALLSEIIVAFSQSWVSFCDPDLRGSFGSGDLMRMQLLSTANPKQGKCRRCGNFDGCKKMNRAQPVLR
jgi:hypothetical protein